MKLESAVKNIRRIRIATSVVVALALIIMGYIATDDSLSETTRDIMLWIAVILIILSVIIPLTYSAYLAKKGPGEPDPELENE